MYTLEDFITASGSYPERTTSEELTLDVRSNLVDLVKRINNLFNALQIPTPRVTSGFRPLSVNQRSGGAKRSLHMVGKAVDLLDPGLPGEIEKKILISPNLLLEFGLWMEDQNSTPGWLHLDSGLRDHRLLRTFKP